MTYRRVSDFEGTIGPLLARAKRFIRRWSDLTDDERSEYVTQQIRSFAAEVNSAYLEQRFLGTNYRLEADDVRALNSIADWSDYHRALEVWRRDPDNDAAWQVWEWSPDAVTKPIQDRLDTAPKRPSTAKAPPPRGCPELPTADNPRAWDELVAEFFERRHEARGVM